MIQITNESNVDLMARLISDSVDVICIDPPYLYLKNQKLDCAFDENLFFNECKRLLTKDGFIIMFGRGSSFYRWNTILESLGFVFKEEIIWNKNYNTSPVLPISRVHELAVIYCKGKAGINNVLVNYLEAKQDVGSIINDIKRIKSSLNSFSELSDIQNYLETGVMNFQEFNKPIGNATTVQTRLHQRSRGMGTVKSIKEGMKEKSIITVIRDHYDTIHPTQKPVRLIERLLLLVIPKKERKNIVVADFFGGSFSTMEAVYNLGMNGISCEIDKEYYDLGKIRIDAIQSQSKLDLTA